MIRNRSLIAVIGSGNNPHHSLSSPLGQWLAERGFDLINGGGQGVMAETAQAFTAVPNRKGLVVGILPASSKYDNSEEYKEHDPPPGYPNPYTEIIIRTHLPFVGEQGKMLASRNHIIVLSADFIFALPGSYGTQTEIELALEYDKPLIIVSPNGEWEEFADRAVVVNSIQDAVNLFLKLLENQ
jgi:predicted Rossmann-fold nucleotide-binding protein